jgi:hypothetical protein
MKKKPVKKKVVKKKAVKKKLVKKKVVKKKADKKKAVKKKTVNPVIGKMEQEVLKKKQKFKVDYFGEEPVEEKVLSDESSISLQITSPEISTGGEYENENEVENYLMKKFAVDVSVTTKNFDHINDDSVDRMTNVYIDFSPIPKDKSFEEMEEGEEVYFDTAPKWLEEVDNIISKENPDYESLIIYVQECYRGEK